MLNNAIIFLLQAVLGILSFAFLLRFYFQLTRASFQNPFAQLIVTLTNFAVKPLRRVLPSAGKMDLSTLFLGFATQFILEVSILLLQQFPLLLAGSHIWLTIAELSLLRLTNISLSIFLYAVLIQAVLSWVNPYTPIAPTLHSLTNPILSRLGSIIPKAGNFDLSPLFFIIAAQLVITTILIPLENNLVASLIS